MKIKKVLVLLITIFFILIISNNVFAAISEGMSEEFKSILDEEGKLVITDTANTDNKTKILADSIEKYKTDTYGFQAYFINPENTKCRLQRYEINPYKILESYDIEVKYEEKFSNEFKKMTDDGNVYIKSSTTKGENELINNYINSFRTEDFTFMISDMNENEDICTVRLYKIENMYGRLIEQHKVKLIFEEKFSDEFKEIMQDGNIIIKASREDGKKGLISNYCSVFSNSDRHFSVVDVNEDATICTIQMYKYFQNGRYMSSIMQEEHIINLQYDKTMSNSFKKNLNKNGKFEINSVKPKDTFEWFSLFEILFDNKGIFADTDYLTEDMSSCEITIKDNKGYPETHKVEFEYKYDEKVNEIAESITKNLPKDRENLFKVKDMELINYWLNSEDESSKQGASNFDNYSGELKSLVDYKNLNLLIDHRLGADAEFFTLRGGIGLLQHNGTTYYINPMMGVLGNHILYVPENTVSTKEALLEAIQKRVDEYAGKGKVKITIGEGTILEYQEKCYTDIIKEIQKLIDDEKLKNNPNKMLIEEYEIRKRTIEGEYDYFIKEYNDPNGENYFLQSAEGNYWFIANVNGIEHKFIIVKDSKNMIVPKHKTADLKTNVEISSDSTDIPLDTAIEATKMTEGVKYEEIIRILNVEENETFDLNLFSKTLNKYIKKLDNGTFEVKIPIPDSLKNKKLVAYYVDKEGKIEDYEVEIKNEYAIFKTNHFSTYTLAEEKVKINEDNNKENINTDSVTNDINIDNHINKQNNSINPHTGDNIIFFIGMFIISILGIAIIIHYKKEYKNK